MTDLIFPDLSKVATAADVAQKGGGKFAADYINWARIAAYLREHAPGWQPFAMPGPTGNIAWPAPDGSFYLLIGFRHPGCGSEGETQLVPHAIMDHTMKAKKNPDARDVADAFVRGMCKAAALHFGLAWELWSKDDPMARGHEIDQLENFALKGLKEGVEKEKRGPAPYDDVDDAHTAIKKVTSIDGLKNVWTRITVSQWGEVEMAELTEEKDNKKYLLTPAKENA